MPHLSTQNSWLEKSAAFDWEAHRRFLQPAHFRPLFDRAFGRLLKEGMAGAFEIRPELRSEFFAEFDRWVNGSALNRISGLEAFRHRDFIVGVTHALDDLHMAFRERLVCMEQEYAYHRRVNAAFPHRRLETLRAGDVLVLAIPFAWFGDLHPQTKEILQRCLELDIPVHVDAAWYGCTRGIAFDYDHPAIRSVSFSLSKGLGLGAYRAGVRYSRERHPGPVTIINDFQMETMPTMACGLRFMREFGSDYLQNRYGAAYDHVCERLRLRPTKAAHTAFGQAENGEWLPFGVRPFLRYLVDDLNEFK